MAELDLARSVMAKENDGSGAPRPWASLELKVERGGPRRRGAEPAGSRRAQLTRDDGASRRSCGSANQQREDSASRIDRALRTRYDRLRRSRSATSSFLSSAVPAVPATPRSPSTAEAKFAERTVLDNCEGCGAILYPPEVAGSA